MPPTAPPPAPGPRVVLIGPPGSGKSTVARLLARQLGVTARDTDDDVEQSAGKPIGEIFVVDGEPHFRDLEREAVTTALAVHDGVLALGGGAVLDPLTEAALTGYTAAGGAVVFLDVTLPHAAPRIGFNQARPLLLGNPRAQWRALMDRRRPIYRRVATVVVSTDARTPAQVATEVAAALAAGTTRAARAASGTSGTSGTSGANPTEGRPAPESGSQDD